MKRSASPSADELAAIRLSAQLEHLERKRACRYFGIFMLAFLFLFLCTFGILFWTLPKKSFSENENRTLSSFDSLSVSAFRNGELAPKLAAVFSDQFPFRDSFVGAESYISLLFTGNANGVTVNKSGSLAKRNVPDVRALDQTRSSLDAVKELASEFSRARKESTFVAIPLPCCAYQNRKIDESEKYASLFSYLDNADCFDFAKSVRDTDGIFYKTDHHLNAYGTYLLYLYLCKDFGIEAKNDFYEVCVSEEFYGTAWSQSGLWETKPDRLCIYRYDGDNAYTVTGDTGNQGFYFPEYLEKKDKYAYFLGGNYGRLEICSAGGEERPRLLIIKDSYANSLVPFLARHFDITLIDPRYYNGNVLSEAQNADRCLFLFGVSSLMTDVGLVKLSFNASK